jgi:hypothetical protein
MRPVKSKTRVTGKHEILVPDAVLQAVVSQDKVDEPPHSFYKYPARFSPAFARAVIEAYSTVADD